MGLSFRVRNGTGRFPHAMTAVTLAPSPGVGGRGWEICGVTTVVLCILLWFCSLEQRALGGGFVVWEPHSGRKQSCFLLLSSWCERLLNPFTKESVWCKLSAY